MAILIKALGFAERKSYEELVIPKHRQFLHSQEKHIIALGASTDEKPVGLALGFAFPLNALGQVLSIFVEDNFRHQKIGSQLIEEMEKTLLEQGCRVITFTYPGSDSTTSDLEHILHSRGWKGPHVVLKRYRFDGWSFNPPWLSKPYQLPPDFRLFPWKELRPNERKKLLHWHEQQRFPQLISPFGPDEALIEPLNSLGLRYKDEVVGWMITHRLAPDTIRFSALYIEKPFSLTEAWIKLLIEAINLQRFSPVQWAVFEINVMENVPGWNRFVIRRLGPYAESISEDHQMWFVKIGVVSSQ
jgi:GNAT superfamily N-acetyltransferase